MSKINFQFLLFSEKLKIESKIAQNQFSFYFFEIIENWTKMKWMFSYTYARNKGTKRTFYIQSLKRIFEQLKISKTWLLSILLEKQLSFQKNAVGFLIRFHSIKKYCLHFHFQRLHIWLQEQIIFNEKSSKIRTWYIAWI